jgi:glutathione S-transferase
MCKLAGLDFDVKVVATDDARAELLLLSPSFLVPRLEHDGLVVWDILAIGEYLAEIRPEAGLLPADRGDRAKCRSVSGEMHAGFAHLRAALPMNIKARHPGFKTFSGAQADIDRILTIFNHRLTGSGGPFLFGASPTMADAMFAPVCTRFVTYDVDLPDDAQGYVDTIMGLPEMREWVAAAEAEPDAVEELDVEF